MFENDPLEDEIYDVCDTCNYTLKRDCDLFASGQVTSCAIAAAALVAGDSNFDVNPELELAFAKKVLGVAHTRRCGGCGGC